MPLTGEKPVLVENATLGPTTYPKRGIFLDTDNLVAWGPGIYQRFPQPEVLPVQGLEAGPAGAWDARIGMGVGGVRFEDGRFRMWGFAMPGIESLDENADVPLAAYAESDDGVHWRKPDLGLAGQRRWPGNNLLDIPGGLASVDLALPGLGWKYVGLGVQVLPLHPGVFDTGALRDAVAYSGPGTYLYGSDDGLSWRQITRHPVVQHGDVVNLHVDALRQRYLIYQKMGALHGLHSRRSMLAIESADGLHWEGYHGYRQWREAFVCDDYDDQIAASHGFLIGEYYGHAIHQIDTLYLVVQEFYMVDQPLVPRAAQNPRGMSQLRLAFSHDGFAWRHPRGRPAFIEPAAPGEYPTGFLTCAGNLLEVGDETLLYLNGLKVDHGYGITDDFHLDPTITPAMQNDLTRVHLARMKRDRFASLASTYRSSFDAEIGPRQGTELTVNVVTRGRGTVRVALAEQIDGLHVNPRRGDSLPGFSFDDCLPIQGDAVGATVRFTGKSVAEIPAELPLILRVELDGAEIFGYAWA